MLDLDGEKDLLHLATEGLLAGKKEVLRQLHGQGGGALGAAIRDQIVISRAQHAEDVDSPMALKVLILDRYHRLAQHGGKRFIRNDDAPLQSKGSKDATMDIEQVGGGNRTVFFQVSDLRQVDGVDQHEAGQRSRDNGESQQRKKGNAARQLHGHRCGRAWRTGRTKAISARRWSLPYQNDRSGSGTFLFQDIERLGQL